MSSRGYLEKFIRSDILKSTACAVLHATRLQAMVNAVGTEGTLPGNLFRGINMYCSKGTGMNAETATLTARFINQNDPVVPLHYRVIGTNGCARRVIAMKARSENEVSTQFTCYPSGLYCNNLIPARPGWQIVLLLAGHLTGMASYAPVNIDQQQFLTHLISLPYATELTAQLG